MTDLQPVTRCEDVDGLAVYRRELTPATAGAPRVVVVHGSMDRAAGFVKTGRFLRDLDVVRFDRRGYGRSPDTRLSCTFEAQVDDLLTVVDGIPSVVVGHSLGGVVALAAAQRSPDVVRAVMAFEAPMAWAPWWENRHDNAAILAGVSVEGTDATVDRFMRAVIGPERWDALPESTRAQRYAEGSALFADLELAGDGVVPYDPRRLTVPVIAGHGTRSHPRYQRSAQELARAVPGAELMVVEGASHVAHDTHPEDFSALVRRAVARADLGS